MADLAAVSALPRGAGNLFGGGFWRVLVEDRDIASFAHLLLELLLLLSLLTPFLVLFKTLLFDAGPIGCS